MPKYQPKNSFESPRFCGPRTFMRLPYVEQVNSEMDFIVTGIPFDSGQSFRTGARFGPEATRDSPFCFARITQNKRLIFLITFQA